MANELTIEISMNDVIWRLRNPDAEKPSHLLWIHMEWIDEFIKAMKDGLDQKITEFEND